MPKAEKAQVLIFSTTWCGDCRRSKSFLDRKSIPYVDVNIEDEANEGAAEYITAKNGGLRKVPTIFLYDHLVDSTERSESLEILIEPSDGLLAEALMRWGISAR